MSQEPSKLSSNPTNTVGATLYTEEQQKNLQQILAFEEEILAGKLRALDPKSEDRDQELLYAFIRYISLRKILELEEVAKAEVRMELRVWASRILFNVEPTINNLFLGAYVVAKAWGKDRGAREILHSLGGEKLFLPDTVVGPTCHQAGLVWLVNARYSRISFGSEGLHALLKDPEGITQGSILVPFWREVLEREGLEVAQGLIKYLGRMVLDKSLALFLLNELGLSAENFFLEYCKALPVRVGQFQSSKDKFENFDEVLSDLLGACFQAFQDSQSRFLETTLQQFKIPLDAPKSIQALLFVCTNLKTASSPYVMNEQIAEGFFLKDLCSRLMEFLFSKQGYSKGLFYLWDHPSSPLRNQENTWESYREIFEAWENSDDEKVKAFVFDIPDEKALRDFEGLFVIHSLNRPEQLLGFNALLERNSQLEGESSHEVVCARLLERLAKNLKLLQGDSRSLEGNPYLIDWSTEKFAIWHFAKLVMSGASPGFHQQVFRFFLRGMAFNLPDYYEFFLAFRETTCLYFLSKEPIDGIPVSMLGLLALERGNWPTTWPKPKPADTSRLVSLLACALTQQKSHVDALPGILRFVHECTGAKLEALYVFLLLNFTSNLPLAKDELIFRHQWGVEVFFLFRKLVFQQEQSLQVRIANKMVAELSQALPAIGGKTALWASLLDHMWKYADGLDVETRGKIFEALKSFHRNFIKTSEAGHLLLQNPTDWKGNLDLKLFTQSRNLSLCKVIERITGLKAGTVEWIQRLRGYEGDLSAFDDTKDLDWQELEEKGPVRLLLDFYTSNKGDQSPGKTWLKKNHGSLLRLLSQDDLRLFGELLCYSPHLEHIQRYWLNFRTIRYSSISGKGSEARYTRILKPLFHAWKRKHTLKEERLAKRLRAAYVGIPQEPELELPLWVRQTLEDFTGQPMKYGRSFRFITGDGKDGEGLVFKFRRPDEDEGHFRQEDFVTRELAKIEELRSQPVVAIGLFGLDSLPACLEKCQVQKVEGVFEIWVYRSLGIHHQYPTDKSLGDGLFWDGWEKGASDVLTRVKAGIGEDVIALFHNTEGGKNRAYLPNPGLVFPYSWSNAQGGILRDPMAGLLHANVRASGVVDLADALLAFQAKEMEIFSWCPDLEGKEIGENTVHITMISRVFFAFTMLVAAREKSLGRLNCHSQEKCLDLGLKVRRALSFLLATYTGLGQDWAEERMEKILFNPTILGRQIAYWWDESEWPSTPYREDMIRNRIRRELHHPGVEVDYDYHTDAEQDRPTLLSDLGLELDMGRVNGSTTLSALEEVLATCTFLCTAKDYPRSEV